MTASAIAGLKSARPGVQTFADEKDRARLSEVAVKAFLNLARAWDLSNAEAAALIGVSPSSLDRMKRGARPIAQPGPDDPRLGAGRHLQGPASSVRRRRPPTQWVRRPNSGPLFERRTPIEAMIEGGIPAMLDVRRYVDAVRGGL